MIFQDLRAKVTNSRITCSYPHTSYSTSSSIFFSMLSYLHFSFLYPLIHTQDWRNQQIYNLSIYPLFLQRPFTTRYAAAYIHSRCIAIGTSFWFEFLLGSWYAYTCAFARDHKPNGLIPGDFEEIYGAETHDDAEPQAGQWDAVMTCFFIDTVRLNRWIWTIPLTRCS